jgi:SNF2 family DNA or RNA helicase
MVIGPASSFAPWETEFFETFGIRPNVARLIGNSRERGDLFRNLDSIDLVLATYQMAYREKERLITALQANKYLLVLDEAHHIKNINLGPWAQTVLDLAPYAERRMILTGTPAPRSLTDLWSQFTFLWPSQSLLGNRVQFEQRLTSSTKSGSDLRQLLKPFFIRTKKSDLHLPNPLSFLTKIPYSDIPHRQRVIIRLLEQRTLQEARQLRLAQADIAILRRWRKARSLRLLQAASNPVLLASSVPDVGEFGTAMNEDPALASLLRDYLDNETPAKILFVTKKVRELASKGEKVIVWATFVENILLLERLLSDLNPLKVYGDVPAYNEDNDPSFENRERNISDFKTRDDRPVLIANPAACSESVSLHTVCQHAVYLERTFNCGQFLQSMDRIHRVGMPKGKRPHYHIPLLQCAVEQTVDRRLRSRQRALYKFLDDDMPVFGFEDDSFLADREDDLEDILNQLLEEIVANEKKSADRSRRGSRSSR